MTKGSIGLNAGAIWNLLSDGQHWSFEALRAKSALTDADLWSAIGWLARENKIEIDIPAATLSSVRVPTFIFK